MARANREVEQPWRDPIVEEVRAARAALFAECGHDLKKLVERLRKGQEAAGRKAVTLAPRRPREPGNSS